jgi:hypothetical protein
VDTINKKAKWIVFVQYSFFNLEGKVGMFTFATPIKWWKWHSFGFQRKYAGFGR